MNIERTGPVDVLLVDDDARSRYALRAILTSSDYRIVEAASGTEALNCLLRQDFALILLDVVMPGMDGFEFASYVRSRARTQATPIIFVTGQAADGPSVCRGYAGGAVDYIVKPVDKDVLRAKVRVFADLYREREQLAHQTELTQEAERQRLFQVAELKEAAERRYRRLADLMPQIVWTARPDGRVDYYNRQWFEYTGLSAEQSAGIWERALHPDDVERCSAGWREAVRAGRTYESECRLRSGDGTFRWHVNRGIVETAASGRVEGWLGTFTDIHDTKQLLEDSIRGQREAEEAVRARDEFISVASHELRTPLTPLYLQIQGIVRRAAREAERTELPDWAAVKLRGAIVQLGRFSRLIDELLDVSRMSAGRLELELEEVDLCALTRDVVTSFDEGLAIAGCTTVLCAEAPVVGRWDRLRLEQVVTNLLSNAIRYAPGAPIEITVASKDGAATLTVRDHGSGIATEDLDRIFERFERPGSVRCREGLGVGLYIARQIVETHGGSIRASSSPGAGTTFTVELPLEARAANERTQPPEQRAA